MDKLKTTTLTPSKKKKQEINFKSKVKKLIVNKKISRNDELFTQGAIQRTHKVRDVKVLSDITKLLLQTVENEESADSVKDKGEIQQGSTPVLEEKKTGCDALKGERVKAGASSKEEKQNPEVSGTRHHQEGKKEPSTVAMSDPGTTEGAASEVDGGKCLKMDEAFSNLVEIRGPESCAVGLTKAEKRRKKRKRKGSNAGFASGGEGTFGASLDPSSCLSGSSQDESERHGKESFVEGQDSGSLLSDVGEGATKGIGSNKKKRRSGGRKSDIGISQGFQISELSPDKSERRGKETSGGRRDSGFQVSELPADVFERHGQEVCGGRRDSGFQVSELTTETREKEAFGERRESGNRIGTGGAKEQQKGAGSTSQRKSSAETSQGFQAAELSQDKSERHGKEVFRGRRDSGRCNGVGGDIQQQKDSDLSQGKPERRGKEAFVGSQDSGGLSSHTGTTESMGSNKKKRKSGRMQTEMGIQQGFQVSDLSPDKSQRPNRSRDTSILEDVKAGKKWRTGEVSSSDDLVTLAEDGKVDKPKPVEEGHNSTGKTQSTTKEEQRILLHQDTITLVSNRKATKVSKKGKCCDALGSDKLESDVEKSEEAWIVDSDEDSSAAFSLEYSENDSAPVRKEPRPVLSLEASGAHSAVSSQLQLVEDQEAQEQSYVNLEGFVQFKRSKPSEAADSGDLSNLQFYRLADSRYVLLLKKGSVVHFRGKLTLTALAGAAEVLGCTLRRAEGGARVAAFSPRGSSLLALEALDCAERSDCKEVAVEAVASVGMQKRETRKIEYNFEEGDCLLLLETVASPLYAFLNQHLPGELVPAVEATEVLLDKYLSKELQCTFYRANCEDNVKTFVKNKQWEDVVARIFEQTCEDGPASCTMLCGGKGVGKSTLLRYLVNRSLSRYPRVLCLDFDPGQAEFTVPGCLSAVLVSQPLLGPHYTHLTVPEKSVYLGHVNVSQCPTLYLEAANYIVTFCRDKPEFRGIPWVVNTMGFCKGLGVELTNTLIQMVSPTDLVQIQSQSKKRNFPKELQPHAVADYRSPFRYVARSTVTVDYRFHPLRSSAESKNQEAEWGFDARKLRDIVILSYLSQLVKPPTYSLTEIVPYMTSLSSLKLRICHETVSPSNVLSVLNGCLVALCCTDNEAFLRPSDPDLPCVFQQTPVCDCLGFGIVRGVDMETKKVFLITPVAQQQLKRVNCLVMGAVQLPACVLLNPAGAVGHVPYVTVGPGQPTGRSSRKTFARLLLAGAV